MEPLVPRRGGALAWGAGALKESSGNPHRSLVPSVRENKQAVFDDEMLTIDDLAKYLKLKPQTIYRWAQTGKIPGAKFGKEWRFRRSLIEAWIDRQMAENGAENRADGAGGRAKKNARSRNNNDSSGDGVSGAEKN